MKRIIEKVKDILSGGSKFRIVFVSLISVILVITLLISSTYSIFVTSSIDEEENVYKTGNLDVSYTLSCDSGIYFSGKKPINNDDSVYVEPCRMTVENNGTVPYMFDLMLVDNTSTTVIDHKYVMTRVGKLEPKSLNDSLSRSFDLILNSDEQVTGIGFVIKEDVIIPAGTIVDIDIRVWISDDVSSSEMGHSFSGKLALDGLAVYNDNDEIDNSILKFPLINEFTENVMKASNPVSDSSINFASVSSSSGTNGIYIRSGTENNKYPIYYYRGNVNNNLLFADTCFKVVRTTDTGGLKIIYNGLPSNGQCNNTGTASQISTKAFNTNGTDYESPSYVGFMHSNSYVAKEKSMVGITDSYVYGKGVSYSNGVYTLFNTITSNDWASLDSGGLSGNHYTCFSTSNTCSTVYYIFNTYNYNEINKKYAYYIEIKDGKTISDVLVKTLSYGESGNYNNDSSTIKGSKDIAGTLDYWYYNNIKEKGYSSYIEDTIWCNDRGVYSLGGFNDTNTLTDVTQMASSGLIFAVYGRSLYSSPSLVCGREVDRFTVSDDIGNGDLDYPVGLLTADEGLLAGGGLQQNNNTYYLYTGQSYWNMSAAAFYKYNAYVTFINSSGGLDFNFTSSEMGVRPVISLKPGFSVKGGDGTVTTPYIIE